MIYIDLLKKIWRLVYDPEQDPISAVKEYFHPNYKQCINGMVMNRAQYIDHVIEQRKAMVINSINYKHALEKGNELFTIYYPIGRNRDNFPVEAEVIAYFRFENTQILQIHGQVQLIKGNLSDVDMEASKK